jgi:hypothetical protein
MSERTKSATSGHRISRPDSGALEAAQARQVGVDFQWHFGRITRLGIFGDGRSATVLWEEGGYTSLQGDITDEQWDILKLAFLSTGRIAVLSDHPSEDWMYDYRFLEAVR